MAAAKKAESLSSLEDPDVEALLKQASDAVSQYCNIKSVAGGAPTFARQHVSEKFIFPSSPHPTAIKKLFLSLSPMTIVSAAIDGEAIDLATLFVETSGVITFLPTADRCYWPVGLLIDVVYWAGMVTAPQAAEGTPPTGPALPYDVERAVILTAQQIYSQQSREQFDVASVREEQIDSGAMETRYFNAFGKGGGLPADARGLLDPYVRLT